MDAVLDRHGLTREEYQRILDMMGRQPTLTELGIFWVMWSEHCSYKSSRVHLKTLPTTGSGCCRGQVRTPAPSISVTVSPRPSRSSHTTTPASSSRSRALRRALAGSSATSSRWARGHRAAELAALRIPGRPAGAADDGGCRGRDRAYGNCIGMPTVGGEMYFDESYNGNPLVNVFCLGILRPTRSSRATASGVGNPVFYVGAKTGRDGIHGATMASAEFDDKSAEKRPAVQVGDPFMEKLLLEACLEVMKTDALVGIQDMGAAGLTCSTCEMGARGARASKSTSRWCRSAKRA